MEIIHKKVSFIQLMGEDYVQKVKDYLDKSIKDGAFLMKGHLEAKPVTLKDTKEYLNKVLEDISLIHYHLEVMRQLMEYNNKDEEK